MYWFPGQQLNAAGRFCVLERKIEDEILELGSLLLVPTAGILMLSNKLDGCLFGPGEHHADAAWFYA